MFCAIPARLASAGMTLRKARAGQDKGRAPERPTPWARSSSPPARAPPSRRGWPRAGVRPSVASVSSIWAKRRTNFSLVPRSAASGSTSRCRARLASANSRSPTSPAAASRSPAIDLRLDLADLLADLVQHQPDMRPVEADLGRLVLQLHRAGEGRRPGRHAVQNTALLRLRRQAVPAAVLGALGLLLGLDRLPGGVHRAPRRVRARRRTHAGGGGPSWW